MYIISCISEVFKGWYCQNTERCTNIRQKLAKIANKKGNFFSNVELRHRFKSNRCIYPWDLLGENIERVEHQCNTFLRNWWNLQFTKGVPLSEIFDFSNINWRNVLKSNTMEYARVMGTKVIALCLILLCIKYRVYLRCLEGNTIKILRDVRILGNNFRKLP